MSKLFAFVFVFLASCDFGTALERDPRIEENSGQQLTRKIEAAVAEKLPDLRLSQYARFYAIDPDGNIQAIYVKPGRNGKFTSGSRWVPLSDLPIVFDGGCSVVNIRYQISTATLNGAFCNGIA